jgi:hypothetical protein
VVDRAYSRIMQKNTMRTITATILVLCLGAAAHAQERPEDRVQIRGVAGWAGFGDSRLIHHTVLGGATDIRLVAGLRAGPEVLYHIGPGSDRDITLMPVLSYDFRRLSRVTPFVSGGFGVLRHTGGDGWANSATFGAGGGVKIAISRSFFVAPEVRVGWDPTVRAMISIGYRR